MKLSTITTITICSIGCLLFNGCSSKNKGVWDDSDSTVGSYRRAKERPLWGINDKQDSIADSFTNDTSETDFIALEEDDLKARFSETVFAQPKESPGETGSTIPGIEGFMTPTGSLAQIFRNVYFNTDEYNPKDASSFATVDAVAGYLNKNPETYVFVTGNCDQRGPESYNLSLGSRRANTIRSLLIKKGVNPDRIYTISYGKEKLADAHNSPEAWAKNRRTEFKIFTKK